MIDKSGFQQRLHKIEGLIRVIESAADPQLRTGAVELVKLLMELHGAGIERMMEIIFDHGAAGKEIIDCLAEDDLSRSLLLLYDLHPQSMEARVLGALDKVRPYLRSHGGNVDLLGTADGIVRLKFQGNCNGCASSAMTLKLAIEEAIYDAAPDVIALEVEGVAAKSTSGFVQLERSPGESLPGGGGGEWEEVRELASVAAGAVRSIEVSGRSVLFCRLDETFYAYSDTCPECRSAIRADLLEARLLICSSCGQRFDVIRAGRGLDKPNLHLEPFPLLVEQGRAKVALPSSQR